MKRILTHAFALLVGVALAAALPRLIHPQARAGSTDLTDESGAMDSAKSADRAAISAGRGDGKSAAFRQAWSLLMQEAQPPEERMRAQGNLLREWAKVDLDGAIQAYLGEAWDTRYPGTLAYTSEPLRNALASAFSEQPQEAWKILSRDKMAMQLLGAHWCMAMPAHELPFLVSVTRELPPNLQKEAATILMRHKQKRELLLQLARTGTPEQAERWLMDAYTRASAEGSAPELLAKWRDTAPGIERTHDMMAWASRLRRTDPDELAAEWEKIPEADRAQAARLLLAPLNQGSPGLLYAIDRAVEAGQWQAFTPDLLGTLRYWEAGDANALAEWSATLPAKQELASVYQTALLKKFGDPAQGREWIEQLPEGSWHRDQALAALARSEIEKSRDLPAANRTVETISDPDIRRAAGEALYDHALKQGIQNLR
jgi:hypothetical protein